MGALKPPQSVIVAALSVVPKSGPVAGVLKDSPTDAIEVISDMIAAAVAAYPRAQCDQQGHDFTVYSTADSIEPNLVVCGRCKTSWSMRDPVALTALPDPAVSSTARGGAGGKKSPARRVKDTVAAAVVAEAGAARDDEPAPSPEPQGDEEAPEGAEDEEEIKPGHCSDCGGEVESETFASEVAKNFHGAQLCRDCLLTCETCGNAIESIDQARISAIRWKHRLCLACHTGAAVPEA